MRHRVKGSRVPAGDCLGAYSHEEAAGTRSQLGPEEVLRQVLAAFGVSQKFLSVTGPVVDPGLNTILQALPSIINPLLDLAGVDYVDCIFCPAPSPLAVTDRTRVSEGRENRLLEMKGESRKQ